MPTINKVYYKTLARIYKNDFAINAFYNNNNTGVSMFNRASVFTGDLCV